MNIIPFDDRVLVKREKATEQKVGSIIIPDTAKEKPQMGIVIAVGNDEDLQELVKEGDKVLFAKYAGSEFEIDGEELIVLQRGDLLGKVTG
jgi:chaperonin GroES